MGNLNDVTGQSTLTDDDVLEVVEGLVSAEQSFSAYEVTKILRSDGFWAEHSAVRELVHKEMNDQVGAGKFKQEFRDFGGVSAKYYVPVVTTPAPKMSAVATVTTTPTITVPAKAAVTKRPAALYDPKTGIVKRNARGGISIPGSLFPSHWKSEKLRLEYRNGTDAWISEKDFTIPYPANQFATEYVVDKDHKVVVTKGALVKVGLGASGDLKLEPRHDWISIRKV